MILLLINNNSNNLNNFNKNVYKTSQSHDEPPNYSHLTNLPAKLN